MDLEVDDFFQRREITLNSGDGIVLYTDGITEAENPQKVQYGLERLCKTLKDSWHLCSVDIIGTVTTDIYNFIDKQTIFDDITLVVVKQK